MDSHRALRPAVVGQAPRYARRVRSREQVLAAVAAVLGADPHVRWAYVFGSVARGEPFRDVDVAIMPSASMPIGAVAWGLLVARLEEALGIAVDLIDLQRPNLPLLGPMLSERIVVLDREPRARVDWEVETTLRWLDFRPSYQEFLRIRDLAMRQRLQGER